MSCLAAARESVLGTLRLFAEAMPPWPTALTTRRSRRPHPVEETRPNEGTVHQLPHTELSLPLLQVPVERASLLPSSTLPLTIPPNPPPSPTYHLPRALVSTVAPPIVAVFRLPAVAAAGLLVLVLPPVLPVVEEEVPDELHAASYRRGCGDGQHCQQHPETAWAAGDPPPAIAVASSCCHDFLSFVSGVSVPVWPDGLGGDDRLVGAAGSASSIRRQCDAFSLEIDMLICSSLSFLLGNWHQRQTRKLC